MIETELGILRRTHYSKDITPLPSMDGTLVTVMGWVLSVRDTETSLLLQFGTRTAISPCAKKVTVQMRFAQRYHP